MRNASICSLMLAVLLLVRVNAAADTPPVAGRTPAAPPPAARQMAKYVPVGPVLVFGPADDPIRKLRLLRDLSPDSLAAPGTARYGLEPPMVPRPAAGTPRLPELPWVTKVLPRSDGRVTLRGKFVVFDRDLAEHAETFLEVADAENLHRQAAEKNGGKPLRVVVERLDLTHVSMALARRNDPDRVLAFGEATAINAADLVEIELVTTPGELAEVLAAAGQG